ncbi:uncharacterized protein LOC100679337 isoform X1 [Nasonia vitripennis]|uniref:Uncharacterized protein n=1 Tax=Nasonia vitripennis TaxID=7425 RepID=A0A7M7QGC0_NASVI|nr:uncharacterized protein LOC100679337 isoform X1 [Nasonia vitripennis]
MQPPNRESLQPHDSFPNLQYYEISQSDASMSDQQSDNPSSSRQQNQQPTHLHQINLCTSSGIISQHQLQDILPGTVFGDPSMGHLHYHIYPSRRTINCSDSPSQGQIVPIPACRSHSRMEQMHNHEHNHQHYPRQPQPRTSLMRPPTSLDELAKERDNTRTPTLNRETLGRYSHVAEKNKNLSLVELSSESQAGLTATKSGKCQCHAIHQQQEQLRQGLRLKRESDGNDNEPGRQPPALPPRPPPRQSNRRYELPASAVPADHRHVGSGEGSGGCCKKYVVLCCLCGGLSAAVGSLFLAVHAVLSAHTASLALFETVPSYIPGTMLIFMGLFTMLLARRKHRYGFLMKVCGSVSVVCALVCVLVTVTTTVVHMSRLQGLRECVYTARAKSCTCYGAPQSRASDPGVLFEGTPHCEAVHGALYACLRALFGVSVAGILACIFSCMLVYQLLSHEKKKMYWEQLELRCRSLYGQGAGPGLVSARPAGTCGCCNDCGGIGPWWAQSPGNLYTPNPDLAPSRRWRLPWSRSRGPAPSADSNYGFHGHQSAGAGQAQNGPHQQHQGPEGLMDPGVGGMVPYSILGPQSAGAYSVLQATGHDDHYAQNNGASPYSVLETAVPLWGPPPPYSDPNSPARRPMLAFPAADPRTRLSKRIDNFPMREVDYSSSPDIKRPSGNYENAEQVSNDTDTETGGNNSEGRASRSNKHKKLLKGVENAGFQTQESNIQPKQSESELYFGDVSSCCGPESSLYDVATEKEVKTESHQSEAGTSSYLQSSHFPKRPSSKRSRRQQPQQSSEMVDLPSNSSCSSNSDEPLAHSVHTSADVEYEVIRQQRRYGFEPSSSQNVSVVSVYSEQQQAVEQEAVASNDERRDESDDGAYGADEDCEEVADKEEREFNDYRPNFEEDVRPVNV